MRAETARHRRLMALFDEVVCVPAERQARVLAQLSRRAPELAAELKRMLEGDRSSLSLEAAPRAVVQEVLAPRPARVGEWELVEELGRGGFATVYLARQRRPAREVALKVTPPWCGAEARHRLFFEADALAQLQHPDIPRVFSVGEHGGWAWLCLELIHGVPLERWAWRSEPVALARLLARAARAVGHAHLRGVLHCDLSPRNVLVTPAGEPRVLDFGSARARSLWGAPAPSGTPGFMSPEQRAGSVDLDARADVFALGAILRALAGGRFEAVWRRATAPEREARFPTAEAFARALEAASSSWWQRISG